MSVEKYIKKELLYSQVFIIIGLIAGILGFIFEYQKGLMTGITAGFLPTGIGTFVLYKYAKKKPGMKKNIELKNEERNIFINSKAGHTAFWVSYWYIFAALVLHYSIRISLLQFLIVTIIFMPVVYFLFVVIYHKKY
jgi:hypothetical protein